MLEEIITKAMIASLHDTFNKMRWGDIVCHPAYWASDFLVSNYHSKIEFSGEYSGFLCLSLSEDFVCELLKSLNVRASKKYMLDITSEVSNIVAGNLGKVLGKEFIISIPMQLSNNLLESKDLLHIPIDYKNTSGTLIVQISEKK